jgi:integrase
MPDHLAPITVANRLVALKRVLAVTCPDADLDFLKATIRHLDARPSTDRRARLRTADELCDFGIELMEAADRSEAPHKHRARSYRNGFIIALLSRRPLRRRNLASLELGTSLVRMQDGWRIQFPGEETKTHQPIDVPLPATLIPYLERYLKCHRPRLAPLGTVCRPDSGPLFVSSRTGRAMSGHTINLTVGALIKQRFGKPMCLHMFREAVPTTLAIKAPEHVRIAAVINNHADYRTTERWYNLATMMDAADAHLENLNALRRKHRR